MKSKFHVRWSLSAERDLHSIIEHISKDSITNAKKILQRIRHEAETLNTFPENGRVVPEYEIQSLFIFRELIVPPWRIIYSFSGKHVNLLAVIDSRQNLEDFILRRIMRKLEDG